MGELCDVYDEHGQQTGRIVARGTPLDAGLYYLVVQVWIRNEQGQYLIQQRAPQVASGAGMWATTAGYVLTGESSIDAACREVSEELQLTLPVDALKRFDRLKMTPLMQDIWIASVTSATLGTPRAGEEVSDWMWASKPEISAMIERGIFFAYTYFHRLPE